MKIVCTPPQLQGPRTHKVTLQNKPTLLWGMQSCLQPSFRRRVPGNGNIKRFGQTNPIFQHAQETKTLLSAMTLYFVAQGLACFRQTCGFSNPNPGGRFRFGFPTGAFNLCISAKQSQFFLKLTQW